jgi:nicotinamide phosphoribosyltransferase
MFTPNPVALTDFYKTDHRRQHAKGTSLVYSNLTARESRIPGIDSVVFFGLQGFLQDWLIEYFDDNFFYRRADKAVPEYKRILDYCLGKDAVPVTHIYALHRLGFLPVEIKAVLEGTSVPLRVPLLTIKNTLEATRPEFFWVTNFIETLLSTELWKPITSATIARQYRRILDRYAAETSDIPEFVDWQAHDFSMRGMSGVLDAAKSGAAHLLSFTGTDTIPGILYAEHHYKANIEEELVGGSVPATEHSVACSNGQGKELDFIVRLLTEVYPKGIVSFVSDTWDFWRLVTEDLPKAKDIIMSREGKLVIRPDSGDPVKIICGDDSAPGGSPQYDGLISVLYQIFGGDLNSKGYIQLDSHIGAIYGDSITLERAEEICRRLKAKGFASTNIVLGVGSYTYQYVTRDTFGLAIKATYTEILGEGVNLFKSPKTDGGAKNSAKGLLCVNEDKTLSEEVTWAEEAEGILVPVFRNSELLVTQRFSEIRERLKNGD